MLTLPCAHPPVCPAEFVKRLRYCEYLGKYFCDCCHSYAETCIPARILTLWDFRKYYVSNFSKRLLDGLWHQPVFNLLSVGHSLYAKAKELDRVRVSGCLCGGGRARGSEGPAMADATVSGDPDRPSKGRVYHQRMERQLQGLFQDPVPHFIVMHSSARTCSF